MKHAARCLSAAIGALVSLSFFAGCGTDRPEAIIPLDTGWSVAQAGGMSVPAVGDGQQAVLEFSGRASFAPLDDQSLGSLETLLDTREGELWLRTQFTVPQELMGKDLSCFLGRIAMADRTWLNGIYIGGEGTFPPGEFSAWNDARLYHVPSNAVNWGGANELLVQIRVDGEGAIVSHPFIGTTQNATRAARLESFFNSRLNLLFAFVMVIIAIYHLILFAKRPAEKESLVFAVLNIVSALYMSVFYLTEIPGMPFKGMSFLWFQKIFSSSLPFVIVLLVPTFANSFMGRRDKKPVLAARIALCLVPVAISLAMPDYVRLRAVRPLLQLLLIPPVLYTLGLLIYEAAKKRAYAMPLLLGFSPMVATLLIDLLLHNLLGLWSLPYVTSYGWQLVIIALLFVLATKFARSRSEAEDLNLNLEKKVAQRTNELTAANADLAVANTELAAANERAARDVRLAAFVQQSFYARSVPQVQGWDIALHFAPMAGVSGDLYDFFVDGRDLQGLGLFDVSGHGISSGLVTMLAKNVIDRTFAAQASRPLANVVTTINDTIVKEKGDIQNYLTGVMLRTDGSRVEYVNAGHPPMFYRLASSKVMPVELSDKDSSGGIIGMEGIDPEFHGIQFTMNSGDALLLYTDCLSESTGPDGDEQFGYERIQEAFGNATGATAQEKLDAVLAAHKAFTATKPVNDDLTVIVLQRC